MADNAKPVPVPDMTLRSLYRNTLQTAIDMIQDISKILSARPYTSDTEFRRALVAVFIQPGRRLYVGIWFCLLAFVVYFIDSAA
jgi:hypothetical protein